MGCPQSGVDTMNFEKLKEGICGEIDSILVRRWGYDPLPPRQPRPRSARGLLKSNPQFGVTKLGADAFIRHASAASTTR